MARVLFGVFGISALTGYANSPGARHGDHRAAIQAIPDFGCDQCPRDTVGDRVFFGFDSAVLSQNAQITLAAQAAFIKKYSVRRITVAGNADERGTEEYNLALSYRRADAARNFLISRGVSSHRIKVVSYGRERPDALGHDEKAWAQNRKVIPSIDP
jgi:peptidoglycan-associated lipoprotein